MSKSVYSLVLSDEVVQEVDLEAYRHGLSRSAMINQILAEAVSYVTPEKRMREIFSRVESLLTDGGIFQTLLQPSDSMMSLRSALAYKYNPNVRYSLELSPGEAEEGELRVSMRSQSSSLILYLGQFFRLWDQIEKTCLRPAPQAVIEDGRYVRRIRLPKGSHGEQGAVLAAYIRAMDSAMKQFFRHLDDPRTAARLVRESCESYLRSYPAL